MLILSRKVGQSIKIGDDIIVTVTQVDRGGLVRIGVAAPPKVRVDREEVRDRIDAERRAAAV